MNTASAASVAPRRFVLAPLGSEGDLRPFLWLGDRLKAAGHQVRIAANPLYAGRVEAAGHAFLPVGAEGPMRRLLEDERLWMGMKGSRLVMQSVIQSLGACAAPFLERSFEADAIVGSSFSIGAACAAEARGIPFVRVHLQPSVVRSVKLLPVLAPSLTWLRRMPAPLIRGFFRLVDLSLDGRPLGELNTFRLGLGLAPWKSFYRDAFCSGDATCGLFPAWFAQPQSDWPDALKCFDFPLGKKDAARPLSQGLREFLDAGQAPVLWTHGSANLHTEAFDTQARKACRELGLRGIIVTPSAKAGSVSEDILSLGYAPFETLLPHCRAIVHHGGIGTLAEALRAGVPQLVIPRAHDQFDNGDRAERLGFGLSLDYRKLGAVGERLKHLLGSQDIARSARRYATVIEAGSGAEIVPWLEALPLKSSSRH